MCGIYGAFDLGGRRAFPRERLAAMGAALDHRGPDDRGEHVEPGLALGARRLVLGEPVDGHPPVTDGRFVAVVDGALTERASERARLAARGVTFHGASDSELWVHAYAEDGEAYLAQARGPFALAIWDRRDRRLVLARDRFGVCPLHVTEADGWLLFASEIKALFATGLVRAALDPRAVDHVLACLCASPVRSAFAGVAPVPPGHRMVARERTTISSRFADLEFPARGYERRASGAREIEMVTDALDHTLASALARRLAAEAPVAIALSGGVDSSLLVAMAARTRSELTAFTIQLDGVGPDEAELAAVTARRAGVDHVIVPLDAAGVGALFPAVVTAAEVPILDHASTAMLALARAARARGFKAVVGGEGADEAFAGYPWTALAHRGGAMTRAIGRGVGALVGGAGASVGGSGDFAGTGAGQLYALTSRVRAFLYARPFWEQLGRWSPADDHAWDHARVKHWHPLHRSLYADYECELAGHVLADKGDRVARAAGIEPRFPYLDEAVVGLAATLDPRLKISGGRDKWILREVARRYLPPDIALRAKAMFRVEPVIHGAGRPAWVDELLSPPSLQATGLFDPAKLARVVADQATPSRHPRSALLQAGLTGVVSTQLLAHVYCGGGLCSLPAWAPPAVRV